MAQRSFRLDGSHHPTWTEWIVVIVIVFLFVALIGPSIITLLWVPLYLVFGWMLFLGRSAQEMTLNFSSLAWFTIGLTLLVFLAHHTLGWLTTGSGVEAPGQSSPEWPLRRTLVLVWAVLASFIAGVCLVGMTHEVVWMATAKEPHFWLGVNSRMGAPRRSESRNNLKQMGLAFHNYHETYQALPASMTFDDTGRARHGWVTALLPYMDDEATYAKIRLDLPWSDEENRPAFEMPINGATNPGILRSPRTPTSGNALIDYAGNSLVLQPGRPRPFSEITDGLSNTLLVGEVVAHPQPWGQPGNCRDPRLGINQSPHGFGSPFKGGCNYLMADGAVRFMDEKIDPQVLEAIATPHGGEPAHDF